MKKCVVGGGGEDSKSRSNTVGIERKGVMQETPQTVYISLTKYESTQQLFAKYDYQGKERSKKKKKKKAASKILCLSD